MKPEFLNASADTKLLNPHLFPKFPESVLEYKPKPAKRVRQSSRPLMNRLEAEWFSIIQPITFESYNVRPQAVRFQLCNGVTYTPDFFCFAWTSNRCDDKLITKPRAWEVKGKHAWDDSLVKLKMAAKEWPEIQWVLVWKENGEWTQQDILP